ncbi:MAG: hypothetical protein ACI81L_002814 [Verrucomicrobiales bacterium]|jgi:hypothetical protein
MRGIVTRTGGAAALVAVLLVAWIVLFSAGDLASDLATEALEPSPTTSPTTSTAAIPTRLAARTFASPADAEPQAVGPATTAAPGHPGSGLDVAWAAAPKDDSTATPIVTATTAAPAPGPAPVRISKPACATGLGAPSTRTAPFTGLSASIPSNMPAVVVKVSNNNSSSRSVLIGLDQADIVFEERIEVSATRFFSVFHSSLPANVGPVRSGRTIDIQITQNLNRPVFAYSGSNQGVARQLKFAADNGLLVPYVNTDRAPFARDSRYSSPDNLFVDPASLGACGGGGNPTAVFSYGSASSTTAQAASSVSLQARSPYRFDWNGSRWVRSQSGSRHVTRTGAELAPTNVVVMFLPYVQSQIDSSSVDAQTIGSGSAWIFRDGTVTLGSWTRNKGHEPYSLTDGNGSAVRLAAGQTWVVLAPVGSASWS